MKTKLRQHFGDKIVITDIDGKSNVVTFRTTASAVLQDFYAQRDDVDIEEQKMNIINTAAKLIKNDIKSIATSRDNSAIATDAESHVRYLPATLSAFLIVLFLFNRAGDRSSGATTSRYCSLLTGVQFNSGEQSKDQARPGVLGIRYPEPF